jgi:hypothetical protein
MVVTPVVALIVATVVWRVRMPEDPNPRYGAVAGVLSGTASVFVSTTLILVIALLEESAGGALLDGFTFASIEFFVVVYGFALVYTLPFVGPIGAAVGYGYERYLARHGDSRTHSSLER